jgi:hypothetical protein
MVAAQSDVVVIAMVMLCMVVMDYLTLAAERPSGN